MRLLKRRSYLEIAKILYGLEKVQPFLSRKQSFHIIFMVAYFPKSNKDLLENYIRAQARLKENLGILSGTMKILRIEIIIL